MRAILNLLGTFVGNLFKSRRRLEIENLFLRHQLNIALRRAPHRLRLRGCDRALLVWITQRWPSLLGLACVVQPGTILRWHRAGFRAYWRWKSRGRPGRPRVSRELREMIRRMCKENPLWGAPRIHGEVGAASHGNASTICCASHSAVACRVTANQSSWRRPWPTTRNANKHWNVRVGTRHRSIAIWCATTTALTGRPSQGKSGRWGLGTARFHRDRHTQHACLLGTTGERVEVGATPVNLCGIAPAAWRYCW